MNRASPAGFGSSPDLRFRCSGTGRGMKHLGLLCLLALAPLLLAGCTVEQGADGQSFAAAGSIAHQGAGDGTQRSAAFTCDGAGAIQFNVQVGSGTLVLKVLDGDGRTAFSKTFGGPKQAAGADDVRGEAGAWRIEATRSAGLTGPFSGQYHVDAAC